MDPWGLLRIHPRYGNYGGKGHTGGPGGFNKPVDSMDECFKVHDKCYYNKTKLCGLSKSDKKNCDTKLVKCLYKLSIDPRYWDRPAKNPIYAQFYITWAIGYFQ